MTEQELTYSKALEELRSIHARLRSDDVDVDHLLQDVSRAAELLEFCQGRINAVGEQLDEVLVEFERPRED